MSNALTLTFRRRLGAVAFFKMAHALGLIVGASVKSDLGFRNRRTSSGELHLDRCPILLFVLPRFNARAGAMSDLIVCANMYPRFAVSEAGAVRYVGSATEGGTLDNVTDVRCVRAPAPSFCPPPPSPPLPSPSFPQPSSSLLGVCAGAAWQRSVQR